MRRNGAWALLAVLFADLMLWAGGTLPSPLYPLYEARFGFGAAIVTVVYAAYAGGTLAMLVLVGRISDRVGRRPVLLVAIGLALVSTAVFLGAQGVGALIVGRVLSGASVGLTASTAAAYLVELGRDRRRAALIASTANMAGLALGPLLSGLISQVAPMPTRLTYVALMALLVLAALAILRVPETVLDRERPRLAPQLPGVPSSALRTFLAAAAAAVAGFAFTGLTSALIPTFLQRLMGHPGQALVGVVVAIPLAAGALVQLGLRGTRPRVALLFGTALLLPALAMIVASLRLDGLALLLVGAVLGGSATGLALMGGQATLNAAAPPARRAEVLAGFYVATYVGISAPVVGVGVLTAHAGLVLAVAALAALIALLVGASAALIARDARARGELPMEDRKAA